MMAPTDKEHAIPSAASKSAADEPISAAAAAAADSSDDESSDDESRNDDTLRPGDVIEYFNPIGVVGDRQHLQRAIILAVDPNDEYKLTLSTNMYLPDTTWVKKVSSVIEGNVVHLTDMRYWFIKSYTLEEGGSSTAGADAIRLATASISTIVNRKLDGLRKKAADSGVPTDMVITMKGGGNNGAVASIPIATATSSTNTAPAASATNNSAAANSLRDLANKNDGGDDDDDDDANSLSTAALLSNKREKCTIVGCPKLHEGLHTCSGPGCDRQVHIACFTRKVQPKLQEDVDLGDSSLAFCTKSCFVKYQKYSDKSNLGWNQDGKNGIDDPMHSERVIVDWFGIEGNYNFFRSGTGGMTKKKIIEQRIKPLLKSRGVLVERTTKEIWNKIEWIESKMRAAISWSEATGQGVKEDDGEVRYNDLLRSRFLYYFDLYEVFIDRAGMKPKATTDDMDDKDDDDDELAVYEWKSPPEGFFQCLCGEDRDACGSCGAGWGRKQQRMVDSGEGKMIGEGQFLVKVKVPQEKTAASASSGSKRKPANTTPCKSPSPSKKSRKSHSAKKESSGSTSSAHLLNQLVALKLESMKEKKEEKKERRANDVSGDVLRKVALAKKFKEMTDALDGDRVMAAKCCPDFKIFLKRDELDELEMLPSKI